MERKSAVSGEIDHLINFTKNLTNFTIFDKNSTVPAMILNSSAFLGIIPGKISRTASKGGRAMKEAGNEKIDNVMAEKEMTDEELEQVSGGLAILADGSSCRCLDCGYKATHMFSTCPK